MFYPKLFSVDISKSHSYKSNFMLFFKVFYPSLHKETLSSDIVNSKLYI